MAAGGTIDYYLLLCVPEHEGTAPNVLNLITSDEVHEKAYILNSILYICLYKTWLDHVFDILHICKSSLRHIF